MPIKDKKTLNQAFKVIKKAVDDEDVIMTEESMSNIKRVECDSFRLSSSLGQGGWPRGKLIELFGPESGGKSTLALMAGKNFQAQGLHVTYIDMEYTFDHKFARRLGFNPDDEMMFTLAQPIAGEDALQIMDTMVDAGSDLIIMDSVAAMTPKAELAGDYDDKHMGLQARMMGQGLRKLAGKISRSGTTIIFINQLRMKIGVMFGNPETTPGGNALKFYASIRIRVTKKEYIEDKDNKIVGLLVGINPVKNKTAPPKIISEIEIYFTDGIDSTTEWIDEAIKEGILEKSGSWYSNLSHERFHGKKNLSNYYKEHLNEFKDLQDLVQKTITDRNVVFDTKTEAPKKTRKAKNKKDKEDTLVVPEIVSDTTGDSVALPEEKI